MAFGNATTMCFPNASQGNGIRSKRAMTPHNAITKQASAIQSVLFALMETGNATTMCFPNASQAIGFSNKHALKIHCAMSISANVHQLSYHKSNANRMSISLQIDVNQTTRTIAARIRTIAQNYRGGKAEAASTNSVMPTNVPLAITSPVSSTPMATRRRYVNKTLMMHVDRLTPNAAPMRSAPKACAQTNVSQAR